MKNRIKQLDNGDFEVVPEQKTAKFVARMELDLRERLNALAKRNERSMNSELVVALKKHLGEN
ncbi:orf omegA-bindinG-regulatory protein compleX [Caudoviricetes sp.]|nr:orf omegA-bindinG-regulatory protein compleX [Caudoviricetes sp.]